MEDKVGAGDVEILHVETNDIPTLQQVAKLVKQWRDEEMRPESKAMRLIERWLAPEEWCELPEGEEGVTEEEYRSDMGWAFERGLAVGLQAPEYAESLLRGDSSTTWGDQTDMVRDILRTAPLKDVPGIQGG